MIIKKVEFPYWSKILMKERDPKLDSNDTIMLKLIPFSQNSTKCVKQYVRLYGNIAIEYLSYNTCF